MNLESGSAVQICDSFMPQNNLVTAIVAIGLIYTSRKIHVIKVTGFIFLLYVIILFKQVDSGVRVLDQINIHEIYHLRIQSLC